MLPSSIQGDKYGLCNCFLNSSTSPDQWHPEKTQWLLEFPFVLCHLPLGFPSPLLSALTNALTSCSRFSASNLVLPQAESGGWVARRTGRRGRKERTHKAPSFSVTLLTVAAPRAPSLHTAACGFTSHPTSSRRVQHQIQSLPSTSSAINIKSPASSSSLRPSPDPTPSSFK